MVSLNVMLSRIPPPPNLNLVALPLFQAHSQACGVEVAKSLCSIQARFKLKSFIGVGGGRVGGNKEALGESTLVNA